MIVLVQLLLLCTIVCVQVGGRPLPSVVPSMGRTHLSDAHVDDHSWNILDIRQSTIPTSRFNRLLMISGGKRKANLRKSKNSKMKPKKLPTEDLDQSDVEEEDGIQEKLHEEDLRLHDDSSGGNTVVTFCRNFIHKTPPFTLSYLSASTAITLLSFFLNQNKFPELLSFSWKGIAKLQFWRLITGFTYLGDLDLFYPLTLQFVHQHMSHLEKMSYKSPEEFVMMMLFGMTSLLVFYTITGLNTRLLGHNLATYLVYLWSRAFEGLDVNFMDFFLLKAEMIPWFFCLQTFLLEQELPVADLVGILLGHCYHYVKQEKKWKAPISWKEFFETEFWNKQYQRFQGEFE